MMQLVRAERQNDLKDTEFTTVTDLLAIDFSWIDELAYIKDGICYVRGPYDYPIELYRIKSGSDVLRWLHHLHGKVWFSGYHARCFMDVICKHLRIKLHKQV